MTGPFVKLTRHNYAPDTVWVNLSKVAWMTCGQKGNGESWTRIYFDLDSMGLDVREAPEEILRRALIGTEAPPDIQLRDGVVPVQVRIVREDVRQ